jgi:hypothetical protein
MPKERTEAERQSDIRRDKAAWMNEQLAERLPDADYQQPGVAPAKDARPDNEFPVQGDAKAAPKAAPKP